MRRPAVRLCNISKHYKLYEQPEHRLKELLHPFKKQYHRKHQVLHDINLEIQQGEILGVVGKNGSGKSTLLKLIAGIIQPSSGTVEINGSVTALLELGGGFNPEFSGMQNIHFAATLKGLSGKKLEDRKRAIVEFADIGEYIHQPVKTYSSGMKTRLSFAIAVNVDTDILILDEVLAVGDELFRRKCYAKMEAYFSSGKTIIYVSHNANSVMELCSRAVFLDSSTILLQSDAKTVVSYYQKFLYAKKEDRQQILQEIQTINLSQSQILPIGVTTSEVEQASDAGEQYLAGLKPESRVEYRNYPVAIDKVMLRSQNNSRVNVLRPEKDYLVCMHVTFDINVSQVGFSFAIKNERGVDICTYRTLKKDLINVRKGESFEVSWSFSNTLLPGLYYINVGVRAYPEDAESYILNRIVDAEVFKVESSSFANFGGVVSMGQTMTVKKSNPSMYQLG